MESAPESPPRNCLVVCGPTASGKTTLGVHLSLELGGEVISADSRQVYRGMDLGAGKDLSEYSTPEGRVPYHLIDIADPSEVYSLFHYQRDFYRVFAEIAGRGRLPVLVGGTGLYVEAVLKKFEVADVPADEAYREQLEARNLEDLVGDLSARSPELHSRTVLDCKRRVIRALEIARHTKAHGMPPTNETDLEFRPAILHVSWPRDELRARIRRRLEARLAAGMVEEIRGILGRGIPRWRYELFGMEYRHVARFLEGRVPRDRMVEDLFHDIWYLARRQETYFRGMAKRGLEVIDLPRADLARALEIVGALGLR
jgi:tRNA dimethylallyltransferase